MLRSGTWSQLPHFSDEAGHFLTGARAAPTIVGASTAIARAAWAVAGEFSSVAGKFLLIAGHFSCEVRTFSLVAPAFLDGVADLSQVARTMPRPIEAADPIAGHKLTAFAALYSGAKDRGTAACAFLSVGRSFLSVGRASVPRGRAAHLAAKAPSTGVAAPRKVARALHLIVKPADPIAAAFPATIGDLPAVAGDMSKPGQTFPLRCGQLVKAWSRVCVSDEAQPAGCCQCHSRFHPVQKSRGP